MNLDRTAAFGRGAWPRNAEFARPVVALLVAQRLEPHQKVDFAGAVAEAHVAEVALVDELEVVRSLLGRANVGRNAVLRRPALRQALEHRVAVGQMGVDGGDELALELERQVPDEAQQDRAHVVVAQQQLPQRLGEVAAERVLLELPDDGLRAVVDERSGAATAGCSAAACATGRAASGRPRTPRCARVPRFRSASSRARGVAWR